MGEYDVPNNSSENNTWCLKGIKDLVYLLSCAVNKTKPDEKLVEKMDLVSVYRLASFHSVISLTAFALEETIDLPTVFEQAKKKRSERSLCSILKGVISTINFPNKRFGICR